MFTNSTVVFIDASIPDYNSLKSGVIPGINIVTLSPHQNGIYVITHYLQQNPQVTTVHIISHGTPGCLYLGNSQLNLTNIDNYHQHLYYWSNLNILVYGCNVAAGDAGAKFMSKLHQITNSTISASVQKIGNAASGGNWQLEVRLGSQESENQFYPPVFNQETLTNYQGVLSLNLVGDWDLLSSANAVSIAGNYAYAVGNRLEIIDISNFNNPILKGSYDISNGQSIEILNNYAYVADGASGLQIINISNPARPTLVANYNTSGYANSVKIVGNYAYVADGASGLEIINISNPARPTLTANYNTPGYANSVKIVGNYAYVADGASGLEIINISNPSNPRFTANYNTSGYALGVEVVNNFAYVADGGSGLQVINVSNPINPTFTTNYDTPGYALDVEVLGSYAYVADNYLGLRIIDISNPTSPILQGTYDTSIFAARDVDIIGNHAYVADNYSGISIIDISNQRNPRLKGTYDTASYTDAVEIVDNYAYVADRGAGLQIIDIGNPNNPTRKGKYETPNFAPQDLKILGNYAYIADGASGLQIIDISNHSNPTLVGTYNTPGYAEGVKLVGNYAYVGDGLSGLQIIDISNPNNPRFVGSYNTSGYAEAVEVVGSYAYISDGLAGLTIVDVSNPRNPTFKGNYNTSGVAQNLEVVGSNAYVSDGLSGLQIIDVANPSNPRLISNYNTSGYAQGLRVLGNYAYLADGSSGLTIIDISNPMRPNMVANYNSDGYAKDIQVSANYAYLGDGTGGLKVIDLGDFGDLTTTPTLAITANNAVQTEGNSNTKQFTFTVTRSGSITSTNGASWRVVGTGINFASASDFGGNLPSGTLNFAPGETSKTINVNVTGDTLAEADETFTVLLSNPTNRATISTSTATGTILDDDTVIGAKLAIAVRGSIQQYDISSYNQSQDITGLFTISGNQNQLQLTGNTWKKLDLGHYNINSNTILEFEYQSTNRGEIQGIGFDNDDIVSQEYAFQLSGTQNWGIPNFKNYNPNSGWKTYSISVGEYFTGNFKYLTFINDHDISNPTSNSQFRNIKLYDTTTSPSVQLNITGTTRQYNLSSYDSSQDITGQFSIPTANQLQLTGNTWKKLDLGNYNINSNTILEFEYQSTNRGEIQGIGFDNDDIVSQEYAFQLSGTQNWGIPNFKNYNPNSGWKTYSISVGEYFTGNFKYLTFINDHDISNPTSNSQFRNIKLYEPANIITGTNNSDLLTATPVKDSITGRLGADYFVYSNRSNSLLSNFDTVTDFNASEDRFVVGTETTVFRNVGGVTSFDVNGISQRLTSSIFTNYAAAQFTFGSRTFVALNDGFAGFNPNTDAIIEVTGLTGNLTVNSFVV